MALPFYLRHMYRKDYFTTQPARLHVIGILAALLADLGCRRRRGPRVARVAC